MMSIRPIIRPLLQAASAPFTPQDLFASGEQGAWYDISEVSSLYQNDNFTTSVTASGQAVGGVLDLSGNGNHAINSNAARRPDYIESGGAKYLLSNGVDDSLTASAIDWGSDTVTIVAGTYIEGYSGWFVAFGTPGANGTWGMLATPSGTQMEMRSRGTAPATATDSGTVAPPGNWLLEGFGRVSDDSCRLTINSQSWSVSTDQGTGSYANTFLRLFNRVTDGSVTSYNGRLYSLIAINRELTAEELTLARSWTQSRMPE